MNISSKPEEKEFEKPKSGELDDDSLDTISGGIRELEEPDAVNIKGPKGFGQMEIL